MTSKKRLMMKPGIGYVYIITNFLIEIVDTLIYILRNIGVFALG